MPLSGLDEFEESHVVKREVLGQLADLLERKGIGIEDIGEIRRVSLWQGMSKNDDGDPEITDLMGIQFSPAFESGPAWPVIQPGKPCVVKPPKLKVVQREGFKVAMTLPDIQFGYFYDTQGTMHATHDESALEVALQLVRYIRPDHLVLHGDNADFPELSTKFRRSPAFAATTQATIDRASLFAAELRAAAGDECNIQWLEGNHEFRLSTYIIDNASAAFGLRVGNAPDGWPVLSIPNLCHLDAHGISYLSGYPANETWINDRLRVIHGHQVVSNGSTAHKYLAHERVSTVYGHIHRREWAERTRRTREGRSTILALSPGCLCNTQGAVPSTKAGFDVKGMPVYTAEDWQQGIAVFQYEPGEGRFVPEQVPILDGWTLYHGKEFRHEG
jgi:hypothetical protein